MQTIIDGLKTTGESLEICETELPRLQDVLKSLVAAKQIADSVLHDSETPSKVSVAYTFYILEGFKHIVFLSSEYVNSSRFNNQENFLLSFRGKALLNCEVIRH